MYDNTHQFTCYEHLEKNKQTLSMEEIQMYALQLVKQVLVVHKQNLAHGQINPCQLLISGGPHRKQMLLFGLGMQIANEDTYEIDYQKEQEK